MYYRITVFICRCKFLRSVSNIGICNFCDLFFAISHHGNPILIFLMIWKTLNTPLFMGMCIYQAHFPLCWTHWSTQAETTVSCSCGQQLISPGMTQAIGLHSSWLELRKLGSCVFYHGFEPGSMLISMKTAHIKVKLR